MEYLRQIEEDIRGLGAEAKKRYPEVKDATERALVTLKTMREMYVADKMRKTGDRVVKFPQSSDVSAPYILACNYADANPKLLLIALSGIQMLVNYEVIPPSDVKNILRVFSIQAGAGKPELQLKLLQILLQLANSLSQNASTSQYLTEATICSFLTLALQLCDGRNSSLSVSSTAFATARQIIAIVMEGACGAFRNEEEGAGEEDDSPFAGNATPEKIMENFSNSAQNLLKDLTLFILSQPGELIRGVVVQPNVAFDLLDDILVGWKDLFWTSPPFSLLLRQNVYIMLKGLLKELQDDFANGVVKNGVASASSFSSRVIRLARCFLLHFAMPDLMDEIDVVITLMIHSMQPDRSVTIIPSSFNSSSSSTFADEASSMIGGAGSLISRLNIPGLSLNKPAPTNSGLRSSSSTGSLGLQASCYLIMTKSYNATSPSSSQVLAHPAGVCLEALISFFSSDLSAILTQERGVLLVSTAITNTLLSVSPVLCGGLAVEGAAKEFDASIRGSQLLSLLEGMFSGTDTNCETSVRNVHEHIMSISTISSTDLLLLSFEVIQVIVRLIVKLMLVVYPRDNASGALGPITACSQDAGALSSIFISRAAVASFQVDQNAGLKPAYTQLVTKCCIAIHESVQESCMSLLSNVENSTIVRRSLGVISEVAIVAGVFGLQHPCDVLVSALCKVSVPAWHDQDILQNSNTSADQYQSHLEAKLYKWKHIQAVIRLFQVVHVLADMISDWDVIVDAIEQIITYLSRPKSSVSEDVTVSDVDKIFDAIGRFKQYTVYVSDDSLIKLMTSLVAMSLNHLSASSAPKGKPSAAADKSRTRVSDVRLAPQYLAEGISSGSVSFSLQAAIEVTKYNSYRVSCVWQMVTSHLRMLATMKNDLIRAVSVAATHDMISTTLDYMHTSAVPPLPSVEHVGEFPTVSKKSAITDDFLFNRLSPAFDTALLGSAVHKALLAERMKSGTPTVPKLSQSDLLSSLKFLATARHDDVRTDIVAGLLKMLQGGGEVVRGSGWNAIIGLIGMVPASMKPDDDDDALAAGNDDEKDWPIASLSLAFNCMKLIVDEFMDLVPVDAVVLVISCLANFSTQIHDVNISLTALEMLWKVYDQMMRDPKRSATVAQAVFDVTMKSLLVSSMDHRPEIRHCAMNTLFAALTMTANASLTSGSQWKQVFDDVVFPLFQRAGDRSKQAAETNEAAIAPELKKGKKMTLHHSRDTAHKQWSETRVLALKGLARVIKTCTWLLLHEAWFRSKWSHALVVCKVASQSAQIDQEVALAGLDVMFAMLRVVSSNASKAQPRPTGKDAEKEAGLEVSREALWQLTWTAVNESSLFECQSAELALHICQSLLALYTSSLDAEFKYSENVRILCETVCTLARPRLPSRDATQATDVASIRANKVADVQLQRSVIELLRTVRPVDIMSLQCIVSAYAEIAFASQYVQTISPCSGQAIYLDCCAPKLRSDAVDFLISNILKEHKAESDYANSPISYTALKGAHAVILEVVFKRFVNDLCEPALQLRTETVDYVQEPTTTDDAVDVSLDEDEGKPAAVGGFFSSFGKMLSQSSDEKQQQQNQQHQHQHQQQQQQQQFQQQQTRTKRKASLINALHSLPAYMTLEKENVNTWTTFYQLSTEFALLVSTIEGSFVHLSGKDADIPESLRQKIFTSLLCVMSPWRVHELPAAKNTFGSVISSDEHYSKRLARLIDLILARGKQFRGGWVTDLVNVLSRSTRLQIHAICKEAELTEFGGQAPKDLTCINKIWKKTAAILSSVIVDRDDEPARKSALNGLLNICKDLSVGVLEEKFAVSQAIIQGCEIFLRSLLDVDSDLSMLPRQGFSSLMKRPIEDELLTSWLSSALEPQHRSSQVPATTKQPVQTLATLSTLNEKAHLVLFAPIAYKLLGCSHGEIKDLANIISANVDLGSLVVGYQSLLERTEAMEQENVVLRDELHKLRSSQHLSF